MSSTLSPAAIILAAGKSTRMKSELPKVLHPVCGRPMIEHVLDAVRNAGVSKIVVVVGHKADDVKDALKNHNDLEFVLQSEQLGTGHAVMMAREALADFQGSVLVLAGDTPLLKSSTLRKLLDIQSQHKAACVIGTAITENNSGLGRIVRDRLRNFLKIVEDKDANEEELRIREINTGCFAFDCQKLFAALSKIKTNNVQSEYYLTDCPEILRHDHQVVMAATEFDMRQAMGVNTPQQLQEVETVMLSQQT